MNPSQILLILQARYKVAALVALFTVAAVMTGGALVQKRYFAETTVMVDVRSPDPIAALLLPATMLPGNLGTQIEIITSARTARKVVKMLRLDENPTARQSWLAATEGQGKLDDWLGESISRGVKVTTSRDPGASVLTISYRGSDPVFVAAVANAYAQAYIEASIELKVEPARQYARWFGDQSKVLREAVEKAQAQLSEYQREKGIVATDDAVDHELTRLNELSARLTAAQAETRDAQTRQRSTSPTDVIPEVLQNSVVQGLRTSIVQLEVKLKEAAGNLGTKHPQFLRMESELAELKARLETETTYARTTVTGGFASSAAVGRSREAELRAAFEAQKKKLLEMKRERDQIAVLLRDADTAKRAYEAVNNRLTQTNLESQTTQTNVTVLSPAVPPLAPSFPKPPEVMLLGAVLLGIVLGGAAALGIEMLDRRIRSTEELAEMLQLPVIGVIARAREPRRLAFWNRRTALLVK